MQRRRGVEDQLACRQFDHTLAIGVLDDQRAALICGRIRQKEREREVGAHPVHQGVVDVRAVGHARLVTADQEAHQTLGTSRGDEDLVMQQRLLDLAQHAPGQVVARRLQVALDLAGVPAGGAAAILEQGRVLEIRTSSQAATPTSWCAASLPLAR